MSLSKSRTFDFTSVGIEMRT